MYLARIKQQGNQSDPNTTHAGLRLRDGLTYLAVAAKENNLCVTKYMVQYGTNADQPSSEPGFPNAMTPIHFAAGFGAFEVFKVLLEHVVNPHIPSTSGATPFYRTCRGGDLVIMRKLKEYDCDMNVRS
jgi:ankyrin repeat protein